MTKYTRRGELAISDLCLTGSLTFFSSRYVEMLEQQQVWLVHGLQELYRRTTEGEGWPGDRLKPEPNGHPLTHDLLTRLGALDHTKSERFEENTDAMQQELWHSNAGHMQRQESSDGSPDSPPSPIARSRFSSDAFSNHRQMPPTPPTYSASVRAPVKPESQLAGTAPFAAPLSMQGVVNPLALQGPQQQQQQQWSNAGGFNAFDEMDLMIPDYSNLSFEDQALFNRPMPMNCMPSGSFLDSKNDYEDFNQFLNPNPTEITSI